MKATTIALQRLALDTRSAPANVAHARREGQALTHSVARQLCAGLPGIDFPPNAASLPLVRVRVPRAQADAAGIARAIEASIAEALRAPKKTGR